ncbi:hypothetical protein A0257_20785 [Hymenobacter psoromatis]|nr:hypothetical protein A0257_20785 [Hymenobacter psoromatis]
MLPRYSLLSLLLLPALRLAAQRAPSPPDTLNARALPAATVVGYGERLPLRCTAAAVGVLDQTIIQRFNESSLASAVNTLPGVRLEERATGSYRISVRGSTLRSPFGVRNVKMYYFDIPFTEANGTSPLNILDPAQIGRIEVLKGPAGSVYGAGTGGVVRLENRRPTPLASAGAVGQGRAQVGYSVGSFGLRRFTASVETSKANGDYFRAQYAHQQLHGYREQSALRRDVFALDGQTSPTDRQTLAVHALYTDLYYQLPGGLTRAEFGQDSRQARPDAPTGPGTVTQRASYASQTGLLGVTHEYRISDNWRTVATLYGRNTSVQTPYLVDWERDAILGGGGRAALHYRGRLAGRVLRVQGGGEFQASFTDSRSYLNVGGAPTTLRYDDEIRTRTGFVFAQADYELPAGFLLTAGASYNRLRYQIDRISSAAANPTGYGVGRDFRPQVSPRLALLKELSSNISAYADVSTGFSPPTEAELRPSDGTISRDLQAERGTSYEVGSRGTLLGGRLNFDVALFDLELRNTIVSRSNAQGIQLFANAGTTHQRGAEVAANGYLWQPPTPPDADSPAAGLRAWASYAYNYFRFGTYESATGQAYGGNQLTGTAPHTLSAGLDFSQAQGFYLSPTISHQSALPLNDANTDYAAGYWVAGSRAGWRRTLGQLQLELYGGVANATNRRYSLGNDLNAFGGRSFEPAPGRNYYGGAVVGWRW